MVIGSGTYDESVDFAIRDRPSHFFRIFEALAEDLDLDIEEMLLFHIRRHFAAKRLNAWPQLQSDERSLLIGKVTDDLAQRIGQLAHERRDGNDLVILC